MRPVLRVIGQSLALAALSGILAFGVNALRPDGLPLAPAALAAQNAAKMDQGGGEIAIKDAALLFLSGRAVFLDARTAYEYQLGHIKGALSLPPREFASQYQDLKPQITAKEAIITYCDGENCPLSHALAKHLREAGLKNVYVLKNGWTLWQAEKLPTAKGAPRLQGMSKTPGPEGQCKDCGDK